MNAVVKCARAGQGARVIRISDLRWGVGADYCLIRATLPTPQEQGRTMQNRTVQKRLLNAPQDRTEQDSGLTAVQ